MADKRVEELKDLFETANFAPNFSWVSNHLSTINLAKGNLAAAEQHAKVCLDRIMDSGETRNTLLRQNCNAILGQCYFEQNNLDLGLAHFDTIPKKQTYAPIATFVFSVCTEARWQTWRRHINSLTMNRCPISCLWQPPCSPKCACSSVTWPAVPR